MPPTMPQAMQTTIDQETRNLFGSATKATPSKAYDDRAALLELHKKLKREAFGYQMLYERQWQRLMNYILGRQWIFWHPRRGQWMDKRMAKFIPRPVTNKIRESWGVMRATYAAIELGAIVRPNGRDPKNVIAAAVADEIEPLIKFEHRMQSVMRDFDSWFVGLGNAFMYVWYDRDFKYGSTMVAMEECLTCGNVVAPHEWQDAGKCPKCGGMVSTASAQQVRSPKGRGCTDAVSPFEMGLAPNFSCFEDLPYLYRKRWRDRSYYEERLPKDVVAKMNFSKSPSDRTLQMFLELARQTDLGIGSRSPIWTTGSGEGEAEGKEEYELWMKPNRVYEGGLVMRIAGDDENPLIIEIDGESPAPGPIPIQDIEGNPLWPWVHAAAEHMGGRILGLSPLEVAIEPQDRLNRMDSRIELSVDRMANPVWLEPKGAEVEKFTGAPGLVVKYNLLGAGQGKPERIPGETSHLAALQGLREQCVMDIEELLGTTDALKGQKASGDVPFSSLSLLVERSQSRFAQAFGSRGEAYRSWYSLALEFERQFGPDSRVKASMGPNKKWAYKEFQRAQLQGAITVLVEDGSNVPKTALGKRAAIDHANQLKFINPADTETVYAAMSDFGLTHLIPGLDSQVSEALQRQDAFEEWVQNPVDENQPPQPQMGGGMDPVTGQPMPVLDGVTGEPVMQPVMKPNPLTVRLWDDNLVHIQQAARWANSDQVRDLIAADEQVAAHIEMYIQSHMMSMSMKQMMLAGGGQPGAPGAPGQPGAAKTDGGTPSGQAMSNSNAESTKGTENPPSQSGNGQRAVA